MAEHSFTFLICSERSGSNFITSLIGAHPAISAPPPSHLFRLFVSNAKNYGDLNNDANWHVLLDDIADAFENQLGDWNTHADVRTLRGVADSRSTVLPLRLIYETEAASENAAHIFVKENHTGEFAQGLRDALDPCRFVWMVRDPRDVAASYLNTDGIPGGVARAVEVWMRDQNVNATLYERTKASEILHRLRYEDLIASTKVELTRICTFLGLPFDGAMLRAHKQERVQRNAKRIDAWENLAKPVLSSNAGKYRNALTPKEIEYIELVCGDVMRICGYAFEIVKQSPAPSEMQARVQELAPALREGNYSIREDSESEVRRKRLAIIERVLARNLS